MAANLQSRNWMLTINNPTKKDELSKWIGDKAKYFVYQHEVGEGGTPHIQGYVIFKGNQRLSGLKKLHKTAHWEVRKGTHEQALAYCTKKDTRIKKAIIWGDPPAPGKRSDLLAMKETIDANPLIKMEEVFDKHFSTALRYSAHIKEYIALKAPKRKWKTEVTVIWGPPGTGKTRLCHDVSPDAYVKDATCKWWDNYDGVSDVILDDFYGGIQHTTMLSLLDRYHCQVECKGGVINFAPRRLFITSNKKYTEWYSRPEGTDNEAWIVKMNAIERRIDNLLTMPELGVTHVVKGVIPTLPVPAPAEVDIVQPVVANNNNVIASDDDEDSSEEPAPHMNSIFYASDESLSDEVVILTPPQLPVKLKRSNAFVSASSLLKKRKRRKHKSPPTSDSDSDCY